MNTNTERASFAARVSVGLATGVLACWLGAGLAEAKPVGPTDIAPCPPHGWHLSPGAPATAALPGQLVAPVAPVGPMPSLTPAPPDQPCGHPGTPSGGPSEEPSGEPPGEPSEPSGEPGHGDEATPIPQPTPPPGPGGGSGQDQAQGGSLAHTGSNTALLTVAGGVLLGGGAGLLALARRMRRRVG